MFGLVGSRSRLAAVGAVVAMLVGGGGLLTASAAGSSQASSFVPITPCRLLDTRASDVVGPRSTPLGAGTTYTAAVWGSNGNCTIPAGATGLSMNVVAISPTAASFLTVFPADQALPLASSLNWVGGQAPTPNAVTVSASVDGKVSFYNQFGSVDLAVDIVGYYELSEGGPAGAPGAPGAKGDTGLTGQKGDTGDPGPRPAQIVWVAKSGGDFTTLSAALASIVDNSAAKPYVIKIAPGTYTEPSGIDMKDYVDIEGSGPTVSKITATSAAALTTTVRVAGVVHGELRNLSVESIGGPGPNVGIRLTGVSPAGGFLITDVNVLASRPTDIGPDSFGIYIESSAPVVSNVTTIAQGGNGATGLIASNASPTVNNVTATGRLAANFSTGIFNINAAPIITNVVASAVDGLSNNNGINNFNSTPVIDHVIAQAIGAAARGITNQQNSAAVIRDTSAQGAQYSIANFGGTAIVTNSTLTGGGVTGGGFTCSQVSKPGPADANSTCT